MTVPDVLTLVTTKEEFMHLVSPTSDRTTDTPAARITALAAPSQGGSELSSWRVEMAADIPSPVHTIDHEQVYMPVTGSFVFASDGETVTVSTGEALIVPGGVERQFHATGGPAETLVCMTAGGRVSVQGSDAKHPIPWAE
jgi:quercetin dioxygenase-like cupin family protein